MLPLLFEKKKRGAPGYDFFRKGAGNQVLQGLMPLISYSWVKKHIKRERCKGGLNLGQGLFLALFRFFYTSKSETTLLIFL